MMNGWIEPGTLSSGETHLEVKNSLETLEIEWREVAGPSFNVLSTWTVEPVVVRHMGLELKWK